MITRRRAWKPVGSLMVAALLLGAWVLPATGHDTRDDARRTAVVSAFGPEMAVLRTEMEDTVVHVINGVDFVAGALQGQYVVLFLSGISVVNAAMTVQLALGHFTIDRIIFSGIAGGVDPSLHIGDVVIADRWRQYLEMLYARKVGEG
jgi:adenosylhomocysteine nucleosidase